MKDFSAYQKFLDEINSSFKFFIWEEKSKIKGSIYNSFFFYKEVLLPYYRLFSKLDEDAKEEDFVKIRWKNLFRGIGVLEKYSKNFSEWILEKEAKDYLYRIYSVLSKDKTAIEDFYRIFKGQNNEELKEIVVVNNLDKIVFNDGFHSLKEAFLLTKIFGFRRFPQKADERLVIRRLRKFPVFYISDEEKFKDFLANFAKLLIEKITETSQKNGIYPMLKFKKQLRHYSKGEDVSSSLIDLQSKKHNISLDLLPEFNFIMYLNEKYRHWTFTSQEILAHVLEENEFSLEKEEYTETIDATTEFLTEIFPIQNYLFTFVLHSSHNFLSPTNLFYKLFLVIFEKDKFEKTFIKNNYSSIKLQIGQNQMIHAYSSYFGKEVSPIILFSHDIRNQSALPELIRDYAFSVYKDTIQHYQDRFIGFRQSLKEHSSSFLSDGINFVKAIQIPIFEAKQKTENLF